MALAAGSSTALTQTPAPAKKTKEERQDARAKFEAQFKAADTNGDVGLSKDELAQTKDLPAILKNFDAVDDTLRLGGSPRLFIAEYDLLFTADSLINRLFSFLDLPLVPALLENWNAGNRRRQQIEGNRKPRLNEAQIRQIQSQARLDQFALLLRRAR